MKDFAINTIVKAAPTYCELDGFGDFVNYRTRRFCTVSATNEEHALEVFRAQNKGLFAGIDFFAVEA